MRWTLAAADVCFTRECHSQFFAYGRTVPVIRGEGVYQQAMDFCVERMNDGAWVHAYPEGRVNAYDKSIRLKWGVGRLITECNTDPIVVPFCHLGMDDLLPNRTPYIPRIGKRITVVIGNPMNFSEIRNKAKEGTMSLRNARKVITDQIQDEFEALRNETRILHAMA